MKLLYCKECHSVFNLRKHVKKCECGKTQGYYDDDGLHAVYSGPCIPLGFANGDFNYAIDHQPVRVDKDGNKLIGKKFNAFVIEKNCPTMLKTD